MLGKLLKYDLKWVYKLIVIYYGLALVFALIGRGFGLIENSFIFDFIGKFSCGVSVAMMFNILINNIIRIIIVNIDVTAKMHIIFFSNVWQSFSNSFNVLKFILYCCWFSIRVCNYTKIIPNLFL